MMYAGVRLHGAALLLVLLIALEVPRGATWNALDEGTFGDPQEDSLLPRAASPRGGGPAGKYNWGGNYRYDSGALWVTPKNIPQLQAAVNQSKKVKAVGSRHSFNGAADCDTTIVDMSKMTKVMTIQKKWGRVLVEAGITFAALGDYLQGKGYALKNMASLPHITVGGAISSATHGSGATHSHLGTSVTSLTLIKANGEMEVLKRDGEVGLPSGQMGVSPKFNLTEFNHAVVSMGALGVVLWVELEMVPLYHIRQCVYTDMALPASKFEESYDYMTQNAYSISLFTLFKKGTAEVEGQSEEALTFTSVWIKQKVRWGDEEAARTEKEWKEIHSCPGLWRKVLYDAPLSEEKVHPLPGLDPEPITDLHPGPAHERLPHFSAEGSPSAGVELQAEYFIHRRDLQAALWLLTNELSEELSAVLKISEIRIIAGDDLLLSPCAHKVFNNGETSGACSAIHFTLQRSLKAVLPVLAKVEALLEPFDPLPHWGKVFAMSPSKLEERYGMRMAHFRQTIDKFDPDGKFNNEFLSKYIWNRGASGGTAARGEGGTGAQGATHDEL